MNMKKNNLQSSEDLPHHPLSKSHTRKRTQHRSEYEVWLQPVAHALLSLTSVTLQYIYNSRENQLEAAMFFKESGEGDLGSLNQESIRLGAGYEMCNPRYYSSDTKIANPSNIWHSFLPFVDISISYCFPGLLKGIIWHHLPSLSGSTGALWPFVC